MPSGSACVRREREFHRLDALRSVMDELRARIARHAPSTPRLAASVTLLAVIASGAVALMPRSATTAPPPASPARQSAAVPPVPVKIIGAAPRGENCAEQVWPYIEPRCLKGASDRPTRPAGAAAPNETTPPSTTHATNGAAPVTHADAPPAAAPENAKEPVTLPVPPGAAPRSPAPRPALGQQETTAPAQTVILGPSVGEPRRRLGRNGFRSRHGRAWSRRPVYAFPF